MCVIQRKKLDLLGPFLNVIKILLLRDIMILILLLIDIMILMREEFPGSSEYEQLHSQPDPSDCDHLCKHPCHILLWVWEIHTIVCVCVASLPAPLPHTSMRHDMINYISYQTITSWWNKKNILLSGVFCFVEKKMISYQYLQCFIRFPNGELKNMVQRGLIIFRIKNIFTIYLIFDQISHWWTRWRGTKRSFLASWLQLEMWWRRWESRVSKEHLGVST